jgi:hypothetical protein
VGLMCVCLDLQIPDSFPFTLYPLLRHQSTQVLYWQQPISFSFLVVSKDYFLTYVPSLLFASMKLTIALLLSCCLTVSAFVPRTSFTTSRSIHQHQRSLLLKAVLDKENPVAEVEEFDPADAPDAATEAIVAEEEEEELSETKKLLKQVKEAGLAGE